MMDIVFSSFLDQKQFFFFKTRVLLRVWVLVKSCTVCAAATIVVRRQNACRRKFNWTLRIDAVFSLPPAKRYKVPIMLVYIIIRYTYVYYVQSSKYILSFDLILGGIFFFVTLLYYHYGYIMLRGSYYILIRHKHPPPSPLGNTVTPKTRNRNSKKMFSSRSRASVFPEQTLYTHTPNN